MKNLHKINTTNQYYFMVSYEKQSNMVAFFCYQNFLKLH